MTEPLPPLVRSVVVSWDAEHAFRRFTAEFDRWWPARTHSIGGPRVKRVVFEAKPGGLIYEEHTDGRRFQWGRIVEWDPPRRLTFTWHPSRPPSTGQEVEVRFTPEAGGTRLTLTASKWENWGPKARIARRGYGVGWGYVLNVWAGRKTPRMRILDGMTAAAGVIQRWRGGHAAAIERAEGEIPGTPAAN